MVGSHSRLAPITRSSNTPRLAPVFRSSLRTRLALCLRSFTMETARTGITFLTLTTASHSCRGPHRSLGSHLDLGPHQSTRLARSARSSLEARPRTVYTDRQLNLRLASKGRSSPSVRLALCFRSSHQARLNLLSCRESKQRMTKHRIENPEAEKRRPDQPRVPPAPPHYQRSTVMRKAMT